MNVDHRYGLILLCLITSALLAIEYSYSEQTTSSDLLQRAISVCTKRPEELQSKSEVLNVIDNLIKLKTRTSNISDVAFVTGICFEHIKEYEKAIKEFSLVLELDPQYPNVRFARANSYFEAGMYAAAVSDLSAVLSENPYDSFLLEMRGDAYLEMGSFDKAINDYTQALNLLKNRLVQPSSGGCSPSDESCYSVNDVNLYLKLKNVFLRMDSKEDAIRVLREGINTNPGSKQLKDELRSLGQ